MKRILSISITLILIILYISCQDNISQWTDPNPTGLPPAVIDSVVPNSGFGIEIVKIYGSGFLADKTKDLVLFGGIPGDILEASEMELTVELPMINNKLVKVKATIQGSEYWGYWSEEKLDTSNQTIIDTLDFIFKQAVTAIGDSIYWPAGITKGLNDNMYFIITQLSTHWAKGVYTISPIGEIGLLKKSSVLGNMVVGPDDRIYAPNLRRSKETGWISWIEMDGSTSFKKYIRDVVQPAYIDIDPVDTTMYIASLGFYEENTYQVEDETVTEITDIKSGIYKVKNGTLDTVRVADYSRSVSCKIHDGYLYVTQVGNDEGAAVMRNEILADGLGPNEEVINEYEDIYCIEFDVKGNMYFVPEGSKTLIQYNLTDKSVAEFYRDDIVETANFMCWSGESLYLVYSNTPTDPAVSQSDSPGLIQKVVIGIEGAE